MTIAATIVVTALATFLFYMILGSFVDPYSAEYEDILVAGTAILFVIFLVCLYILLSENFSL